MLSGGGPQPDRAGVTVMERTLRHQAGSDTHQLAPPQPIRPPLNILITAFRTKPGH